MIEPNADQPAEEMNELQRYHAGEPTDAAKHWQAMDDDFWSKTMEGLKEGGADAKAQQDGGQSAE